jgi:hypothetical protein
VYGWRDAQGYDSLYLGAYRRLANAIMAPEDASPLANGNIVFIKSASSPLFPLLSARYLVSQQPLNRANLSLAPGFPSGPPFIYEDSTALPEAFLTQVGTPPDPDTPLIATQPAELVRESAGRLAMTVDATAPGLLVVAEGHAPGWRATVTPEGGASTPTQVVRANTAFQGVPVPAGRFTVHLTYAPASFRVGLFLALFVVGVLATTAASTRRIGIRRQPEAGT